MLGRRVPRREEGKLKPEGGQEERGAMGGRVAGGCIGLERRGAGERKEDLGLLWGTELG